MSHDGTRRRREFATKPRLANIWSLLLLIWPAGRPLLIALSLGAVVFLLAGRVAVVGGPFVFKAIADELVKITQIDAANLGRVSANNLVHLLFFYLGLRFLTALFNMLRDALFAPVALHSVGVVSRRGLRAILNLPSKKLSESSIGEMVRVVDRTRAAMEELSIHLMLTLAPLAIEIIMVVSIIWWALGGFYSLIVMLTVCVYVLYTLTAMEKRSKLRVGVAVADGKVSGLATDTVINVDTVKAFGAEDYLMRRYDGALSQYTTWHHRNYLSLATINSVQFCIFSIGLVILVGLSVLNVVDGHGTVGTAILANALMLQLYSPLEATGMIYKFIKQAIIDLHQLDHWESESKSHFDREGGLDKVNLRTSIKFNDVFFSYNEGVNVLRGLNLEIKASRITAIVGRSGAGKSTIAKILLGQYISHGGIVTFDSIDISKFDPTALSQSMGIVSQDTALFNDTIFFNIAVGRPQASFEDIRAAARKAYIEDFIDNLPDGYNTIVGDRGLRLSGGQRQRLAIARAILKDPPIIILDEATSSLDPETEERVKKAISELAFNRTTIVISHRLDLIHDADEIIMIEDGKVVASGTHDSLFKTSPAYVKLWGSSAPS